MRIALPLWAKDVFVRNEKRLLTPALEGIGVLKKVH